MLKTHDVIAGYYGFGNFGDDLFRDILSKRLEQEVWARPRITQNRPQALAKIHRNVRAVENICVARSITLGGGSILGAKPPFGIRHVEMAAQSLRKRAYCALGVGILGGLSQRPDKMIKRMTWVGLRSEAEHAELSQAFGHVHYMSDLAYAAPAVFSMTEAEGQHDREIAVIPAQVGELGHNGTDIAWIKGWMRNTVVPQLSKVSGLKIMLLQPDNAADALLVDRFSSVAQELDIPTRKVVHSETSETLRELSSAAFVLSDRLHGAIVAHIFGVPFRLSKHHKKCDDFLRDIDHPDATQGNSIAQPTDVGLLDRIAGWSDAQGGNVHRHRELAVAGIANWLDHLQSFDDVAA